MIKVNGPIEKYDSKKVDKNDFYGTRMGSSA